MNLIELAQIYTDLVRLEREISEGGPHAKDRINTLRTKYHEMLMARMREEHIEFTDRFDAMNKAFELVQKEKFPS